MTLTSHVPHMKQQQQQQQQRKRCCWWNCAAALFWFTYQVGIFIPPTFRVTCLFVLLSLSPSVLATQIRGHTAASSPLFSPLRFASSVFISKTVQPYLPSLTTFSVEMCLPTPCPFNMFFTCYSCKICSKVVRFEHNTVSSEVERQTFICATTIEGTGRNVHELVCIVTGYSGNCYFLDGLSAYGKFGDRPPHIHTVTIECHAGDHTQLHHSTQLAKRPSQ